MSVPRTISSSLERGSEPVAGLFQVNMVVPRAGFEHATTRSSAERSPRLSYLGTVSWDTTSKMNIAVLKLSDVILTLRFTQVNFSNTIDSLKFYYGLKNNF